MLPSLFLALALQLNGAGPVDISEQQLTQYVNDKVRNEQQYGLPGLFDAHILMDKMTVRLGRDKPDLAQIHSTGRFTLSLPNKAPIDGTLEANFEAKPRYSPSQGAVYLDKFTLIDYRLTPAAVQQQFAPLVDYLVQGLQQRLANQPAYRLDERDPDQAWLKQHVTDVQLLPGKLRLQTGS